MKIRPISANPTKPRNRSQPPTTPLYTAKKDLKILMSSEETAKFLDSQIFKLTESAFPDFKTIASTQISQELSVLKSFTNKTQLSKTNTSSLIDRLSLEISQVKSTEVYGKKLPTLKEKIEDLTQKIVETKKKQQERLEDREIYFHIEKRLITTKIHLDLKTHYLQQQLNYKQHILGIEENLSRKSKEARCKSARMYKNFDFASHFYKENKSKVQNRLEKEQGILERIEEYREKRQNRHMEIKQQVDDEETIRKFKGIREGIMLHRVWFMFLSNKLNENISKFGTIELAFKKIRGVTGLSDINNVVTKFLTKENSFHELTNTIVQNKKLKEEMALKISEIETKIEKITISERPTIKAEMISDLNQQILICSNRNLYERQRREYVNGISIKISEWVIRNIRRMKPNHPIATKNLVELVKVLKEVTMSELKSLRKKPEGSLLKKATELMEENKPRKIAFLTKKQTVHNEFFSIGDFSELNHTETEFLDTKKKSFFVPLLEKTLKKKV